MAKIVPPMNFGLVEDGQYPLWPARLVKRCVSSTSALL